MIANYFVDEHSNIGIIETLYESYESKIIHKSICKCYRPVIGCNVETVPCIFYNHNNEEIGRCDLTNSLMYGCYYLQKKGILIFEDDKVIVKGWPNTILCYSIKSNKIVWESKIKANRLYLFKNKLYCEITTCKKDRIVLINANTGEMIKEILVCVPKCREIDRPDIYRLDENFLIIYILGYFYLFDMENDILLLTCYRIDPPSEIYWLVNVTEQSDGLVTLKFREFVVGKDVKYYEHSIEKEKLILSAKKISNSIKILTNRETLRKEYKSLFESEK